MDHVASDSIPVSTDRGNLIPSQNPPDPYSEYQTDDNEAISTANTSSAAENIFLQEFNPAAHGLDPEFRLTNFAGMKG